MTLLLDEPECAEDIVEHHLVGAARVGDTGAIELCVASRELLAAPSRTVVGDKLDALSCRSIGVDH